MTFMKARNGGQGKICEGRHRQAFWVLNAPVIWAALTLSAGLCARSNCAAQAQEGGHMAAHSLAERFADPGSGTAEQSTDAASQPEATAVPLADGEVRLNFAPSLKLAPASLAATTSPETSPALEGNAEPAPEAPGDDQPAPKLSRKHAAAIDAAIHAATESPVAPAPEKQVTVPKKSEAAQVKPEKRKSVRKKVAKPVETAASERVPQKRSGWTTRTAATEKQSAPAQAASEREDAGKNTKSQSPGMLTKLLTNLGLISPEPASPALAPDDK